MSRQMYYSQLSCWSEEKDSIRLVSVDTHGCDVSVKVFTREVRVHTTCPEHQILRFIQTKGVNLSFLSISEGQYGDTVKETKLRWFVQRRDREYFGQRMLKTEL